MLIAVGTASIQPDHIDGSAAIFPGHFTSIGKYSLFSGCRQNLHGPAFLIESLYRVRKEGILRWTTIGHTDGNIIEGKCPIVSLFFEGQPVIHIFITQFCFKVILEIEVRCRMCVTVPGNCTGKISNGKLTLEGNRFICSIFPRRQHRCIRSQMISRQTICKFNNILDGCFGVFNVQRNVPYGNRPCVILIIMISIGNTGDFRITMIQFNDSIHCGTVAKEIKLVFPIYGDHCFSYCLLPGISYLTIKLLTIQAVRIPLLFCALLIADTFRLICSLRAI